MTHRFNSLKTTRRTHLPPIRKVGVLAILPLIAMLAVVPMPAANAYTFLCGRFAGSNPLIHYKFTQVAGWGQAATNNASAAWNNTSAPGTFGGTTGSDPEIDVYDNAYAATWWAQTEYVCSNGFWEGNEVQIFINTDTLGPLSDYATKLVMEHELGHAYGLNHQSMTCSGTRAVMEQGSEKFSCLGTAPWLDDVNGVIAKY